MITNQNIDQLIADERKKYKATEVYRIITSVLLILIILLLLFLKCDCNCNENRTGIPWDSDVTFGEEERQSVLDSLNEKVAEGMIRISMNADPIFENGKAKGNVTICNKPTNVRPLVVEIYLKNDDGTVNKEKLVYRSGKIPIGGKIQTVAMNVNLPKGNYAAWACFNAISDDDDEIVGTAGADITLHILN